MDTRKVKDAIANGEVHYNEGDVVIVYRRKANGYPRHLKDSQPYVVVYLWGESVEVVEMGHINNDNGRKLKVHTSFIIHQQWIRDKVLEDLLKDQEQ